jgi:hypothetical protein
MIVERRAYTLLPGAAPDFWELQRRYCGTSAMTRLLSHTICYFETVAGPAEQIVHLHRFESLGEWEETYAILYRDHPAEYFTQARELLVAQETAYYRPLGTSVLTEATRPIGPPVDIVEERFDLRPGTAPRFSTEPTDELLGTYLSFLGPLHRVLQYRFHPAAPLAHHRRVAPITRGFGRTLLRPAPVATHRPLFEV